jgi:hypothetical protein
MSEYIYKNGDENIAGTPWGKDVKEKLSEKGLYQTDLIRFLLGQGILEDRVTISSLLRTGRGSGTRKHVVLMINEFLGIPMENVESR